MQKIYVSKYTEFKAQVEPSTFSVGQSGKMQEDGGKVIRFSQGQYTATSDKEIKLLEALPSFNVDFFDLLAQENEAKKTGEKANATAVKIVEGVRQANLQTDQQQAFREKQNLKTEKAEEVAAGVVDNNASQPAPVSTEPKKVGKKRGPKPKK